MMCFRDMTFCPFSEQCEDGPKCPRALTKEVHAAAEKWWGGKDAPIAMFVGVPDCFVAVKPKKKGK